MLKIKTKSNSVPVLPIDTSAPLWWVPHPEISAFFYPSFILFAPVTLYVATTLSAAFQETVFI
jgi:hypothetical protein